MLFPLGHFMTPTEYRAIRLKNRISTETSLNSPSLSVSRQKQVGIPKFKSRSTEPPVLRPPPLSLSVISTDEWGFACGF